MEQRHFFDWHGYLFALKLFSLFLLVFVGGYYGVAFALESRAADVPMLEAPGTAAISVATEPFTTLFSSTTPERVVNALTIENAIPSEGKFLVADLTAMRLSLYENGSSTASYPILGKGRPGTPWETPSGFYEIQTKEREHFSSIGDVYMPWSMQFYGNYFIHGWTYYPNGTPVAATFSGGCIKLATSDAKKIYDFATIGTQLFVYDPKRDTTLPSFTAFDAQLPEVAGASYLVADIDTGTVYAEKGANDLRPIASITKLMTALVANEAISLEHSISVPSGALKNPPSKESVPKTFLVNDLFYPLLMQSSNGVAERIGAHYGSERFVKLMNRTATSLGMSSTVFADTSGISPGNLSTAEDLFRLTAYLATKKSFVLNITKAPKRAIAATDGSTHPITNVNAPALEAPFAGGKVGRTTAAQETLAAVVALKVNEVPRRVALIILGSPDEEGDARNLARWVMSATFSPLVPPACAGCVTRPPRVIEL